VVFVRLLCGSSAAATALLHTLSWTLDLHQDSDETVTLFRLLLQSGADGNAQSSDGLTTLHLVCLKSSLTGINIRTALVALLEHGANPMLQDKRGKVPLEYLVDSNQCDPTSIFLLFREMVVWGFPSAGAGIVADIASGLTTALHRLIDIIDIENGKEALKLVRLLLDHPTRNCSALHKLINRFDTENNEDAKWDLIKLLLEAPGTDCNAQNNFGQTALHLISMKWTMPTWINIIPKALEILINTHGASPTITDGEGILPVVYFADPKNRFDPPIVFRLLRSMITSSF